MASLERKLKTKYHGIYYHNQCKKLLSAPSSYPNNDTELLRKCYEENERLWSSHIKACYSNFCVLTECAPDPLGDVRHERTSSCKKARNDVKQAEFNYLCRTLGVPQQDIEVGTKHDHDGQRDSTRNAKASTPAATKRERDGSLSTRWMLSPARASPQDLPKSKHSSLLFSGKPQRTDSAGLNDALPSIVPHPQSFIDGRASMRLNDMLFHITGQILKQATPGPNHDSNLPGHQYTSGSPPMEPDISSPSTENTKTSVMPGEDEGKCRRPSLWFARPGRIKSSTSIDDTSKKLPSFQSNDGISDLLAPLATHQAGGAMLNVDLLEKQESTQHDTGFANDPFDTSIFDDWTFIDKSFPPLFNSTV